MANWKEYGGVGTYSRYNLRKINQLGLIGHTYNLSTWETKAREL
jgi:hypothetical protein